jgi:hypothetical protein
MNKKHFAKRKKVVIDALDGKIINEPTAIKISNVEEYVEKNGFKLIKMLSLLLIFIININFASANILDLNLPSMNAYKLAFTLNLLIILFVLSALCIFVGLKYSSISIYYIGCIILLFLGIMIIVNDFNPLIGIFTCFISAIFIFSTR